MEESFWKKLPRPFFALAPLADVTDAAFRRVIAKYGKPDIFFTEFVSADGLLSPGRKVLIKDLLFSEEEHPIVAQLFTSHREKMKEAATLVASLGFDGLDINMGCPDQSVEKQGAGAALIKTPALAGELIRAAREGAQSAGRQVPISVKTRVGYNSRELETWIPALLQENISALTVHARTRKEMSKVPADWRDVKRVVEIRDQLKKETLIIGNGDVKDLQDGREKIKETGADGIMFGRAIFGNPWLFSEKKGVSPKERLDVLLEHLKLFDELLGDVKHFSKMRRTALAYVEGMPSGKILRQEISTARNVEEAHIFIEKFLENLKN